MKAVVAAFKQEKALVGAFSVITNRRMDLFEALLLIDLAGDATHGVLGVVQRLGGVLGRGGVPGHRAAHRGGGGACG